jgi:hypothetical protein
VCYNEGVILKYIFTAFICARLASLSLSVYSVVEMMRNYKFEEVACIFAASEENFEVLIQSMQTS